MDCFPCSLKTNSFVEIIIINLISGVKTKQVPLLAP